jgi:hypothetical protein
MVIDIKDPLNDPRKRLMLDPWAPTPNNAPRYSGGGKDSFSRPGGEYNTPNVNYGLDKFTAPLSGREKRGMGLEDILAAFQFGAGGKGFDELGKTTGGFYTDPHRNPFFKDVLSTSYEAMQPFLEKEQSRLRGEATAAGQGGGFSSPLFQQEGELSKNVLDTLSKEIAGMSFGEYGRERGYQERAGQESRGLPGQAVEGQMRGGGLERGIAQDALSKIYGEFQRLTGMGEQDMQNIMKILSLVIGPQQTQYGKSPFESIAGAATPFIRW